MGSMEIQIYNIIKQGIEELPQAHKEKVISFVPRFKAILDEDPDHAGLALTLINASHLVIASAKKDNKK